MKTFAATCRLAVGAVLLSSVALVSAARADDVSEEQIAAARATIQSLNLTNAFDRILPNLAEQLKAQLIQASPNFTDVITATVDEKALSIEHFATAYTDRTGCGALMNPFVAPNWADLDCSQVLVDEPPIEPVLPIDPPRRSGRGRKNGGRS